LFFPVLESRRGDLSRRILSGSALALPQKAERVR
jgi:hypothetical protein